jgi:hypothetical protein
MVGLIPRVSMVHLCIQLSVTCSKCYRPVPSISCSCVSSWTTDRADCQHRTLQVG